MNAPKTLSIAILGLLAVGTSVLAWKEYQELVVLRAGALTKDERADLQKRLWDAEKRAKELADQLAAARARGNGEVADAAEDGVTRTPTTADPANTDRRRGRGPGGGFANMMAVMERPDVQRLMAVQQKGQLDTRYAQLFKALGLPPEQLDKLKNLLVEKQTAMQDVMAAARAEGINPGRDPEGFQKMIASTQADVEASIKSTLGDSAYLQYQQYQQTLPQRNIVNQLETSLSYSGSPLSDAQAEQMVQILAQTAPKRAGANDAAQTQSLTIMGPGGPGGDIVNTISTVFGRGNNAPITNDAITLAQGVLSTTQVSALQQLQAQQQAAQQLQQAIRAANQGNQNTTTAPATGATRTPRKKN